MKETQESQVGSLDLEDSPGVGNGNPPQYSWLRNPMDIGAWWATVHGVTKSRTWLNTDIVHLPMTIWWNSFWTPWETSSPSLLGVTVIDYPDKIRHPHHIILYFSSPLLCLFWSWGCCLFFELFSWRESNFIGLNALILIFCFLLMVTLYR